MQWPGLPTRMGTIRICIWSAFEMSPSNCGPTQSAVSQHLKLLRDAEIVSVRAEAQRRIYRLNDDSLREVDEWLQGVRRFWNDRLDRLEQALREEEDQP